MVGERIGPLKDHAHATNLLPERLHDSISTSPIFTTPVARVNGIGLVHPVREAMIEGLTFHNPKDPMRAVASLAGCAGRLVSCSGMFGLIPRIQIFN